MCIKKQGQEIKGIRTRKKEMKPSSLAGDMIVYVENLNESTETAWN